MANDTILLSGLSGKATGDTLQIALGKHNDTNSVLLAHVANTANPHLVTTAQIGAAPLASPAFTGNPTAPTPAAGDNSTALATTAFVLSQVASAGGTASVGTLTFSGDVSGSGTSAIVLTLASVGTAGTYNSVVIDNKGRVTSGTALPVLLTGSAISVASVAATGNVAGKLIVASGMATSAAWQTQGALLGWNYTSGGGETDLFSSKGGGAGGFNFYNVTSTGSATPLLLAAINGAGSLSAVAINSTPVGGATPAAGYFTILQSNGSAVLTSVTASGDVTGTGSASIVLTLAASGVAAGTYALASLVVDTKGRVTSASNGTLAETITATGDATGTATITGPSGTYALPLILAATGTPGTYNQVVTDSKGRVTSGANIAYLTTNQTVIVSGDASGSGSTAIPLTLAAVGTAGTYNQVTTDGKGRVTGGTAIAYLTTNQTVIVSGDASGSGNTAIALTLATTGTAGTYNLVITDAKGRVTLGSLAPYLIANQSITLTGDASGAGATTIPVILAPTGVAAGTYTQVAVDAKGRALAGSNPSTSLTTSGDASGTASFIVGGAAALALTLAAVGTAGTYNLVTVDAKGRVASGTSVAYLTSNQTVTLSGDASGSGSTSLALVLAPTGVAPGTYTQVSVDAKGRALAGGNPSTSLTASGDASGTASFIVGGAAALALTLAAVGAAGTYNTVVTDAKGRVASGTTLPYLTTNQTITISGDASASGSTSLALTLAPSGVVAGTYTQVSVDAKGRALAGFNPSTSVTTSGDVTGSASFLVGGVGALALTLASVGTAGTYNSVVTDGKGRVTSGTSLPVLLSNTNISVGNVTSNGLVSGFQLQAPAAPSGTQWAQQGALIAWNYTGGGGETDFVTSKGGGAGGFNFYNVASNPTAIPTLLASINGVGALSAVAINSTPIGGGTPAAGYFTTLQSNGSTVLTSITATGDVTGTGSAAIVLTLAAVGAVGTYNSVVTDAKGRVTSGTLLPYTTSNQPITVTGDVSGTGTTAIVLTLASVGTAGTYTKTITDAKGRVIGSGSLSVTDVSGAAPLASPALTGTPTAPTPSPGNNSTSLSTTAYVQARGMAFAPGTYVVSGSAATLTSALAGGVVAVTSASTYVTITLPLSTTMTPWSTITFVQNSATCLFSAQSPDTLDDPSTLSPNQTAIYVTDGAGTWRVLQRNQFRGGTLGVTGGLTVSGSVSMAVATASTPATSDNSSNVATTAYVTAKAAATAPVGFRNALINPGFTVNQRTNVNGATNAISIGSGTVSGAFVVDRWLYFGTGGGTRQINQQACTDSDRAAIGDESLSYYVYAQVAGTSNTTSDQEMMQQRIEDVRRYAGKTVTFSFWAKTQNNTTPNIGVNFGQSFGSGSGVSPTISSIGSVVFVASTTWTRYSSTFTFPTLQGKTVGPNNDSFQFVSMFFSAASAAAPAGGNPGVQSNFFYIAMPQLELGSVATPFEWRPAEMELGLCRRFFIGSQQCILYGYAAVSSSFGYSTPLSPMRTALPIVNLTANYNSSGVGSFTVSVISGAVYMNSVATATGALTINSIYTLSAEL